MTPTSSIRSLPRRCASALAAVLPLMLYASPVLAAPGGGTGLERFGNSALDFLSNVLGPIVLGIGIAIAAYSLIFGARDGIQKAVWVVVGGVLLFSVDSLVGWIEGAAR